MVLIDSKRFLKQILPIKNFQSIPRILLKILRKCFTSEHLIETLISSLAEVKGKKGGKFRNTNNNNKQSILKYKPLM